MKNKKGFSLIELLVVVLIIGILSSIAVPNYKVHTIKTKVASNMPLMRALQNDMLNFYDRTGNLPNNINQLSINKAEFNTDEHVPTGCKIFIQTNNNIPAVNMDCHQGWWMSYSLQSTGYGYRLGAKTFNITASGNDKSRLEKVAKSFGWSGSGTTYTIN